MRDEDFFAKYIPLDKKSVQGYMKEMHWLSSIEAGEFDRIDFMRQKGYEVKIGDDGLTTIRHSDFSLWYSYDMESPLSRVLDKDDLDRLSFLLNGVRTQINICIGVVGGEKILSQYMRRQS